MNATICALGRVGNVRVFENEDGKKTVYFSLAVDQRLNGQAQNEGERPTPIWYGFRAVNGTAEMLSQYLQKGRLVHVTGVSPRMRSYEVERTLNLANVGQVKFKDAREAVEYLVVDVRFVGGPRQDGQGRALEGEVVAPPAEQAEQVELEEAGADDLPF